MDALVQQSRVPIRVEVDTARLRPSDNPLVLGSPGRITAETGWRAEIPIQSTLRDLLEYWRAAVSPRE
jgi:GDP-4-dehydro-6-deoxy-D-mannose reductase